MPRFMLFQGRIIKMEDSFIMESSPEEVRINLEQLRERIKIEESEEEASGLSREAALLQLLMDVK